MYTRVESKFWQDKKMRNVSYEARYLMLYLLTCQHRNILGLYFLPEPYACFDLQWDVKRFRERLGELLKIGCIEYDADAHVVFVKNYLKHNPLENPNQVKSAMEKLETVPDTNLLPAFLKLVEGLDKPFVKPFVERLQERLQKPVTVTVTGTVTGTVKDICVSPSDSENLKTEKPIVAEKLSEHKKDSGAQYRTGKDGYSQEFEEFWKHYPRKIEKKRAFRAWNARLKEGEDTGKLVVTARHYSLYCAQQRTEQRYIKHASTFLGPDKPYMDFVEPVKVEREKNAKAANIDNFEQREYDEDFLESFYE